MTETKDISKMSPEEKKAMNKVNEELERKASRMKHIEIHEEFQECCRALTEAFVTFHHIHPSVIKNLLPHPITSSTEAFEGNFGTVTGLILFYRNLFELFNLKFELEDSIVFLRIVIGKGGKLWLTDQDPSLPFSGTANSILIFHPIETTYLKEFYELMNMMRDKSKNYN